MKLTRNTRTMRGVEVAELVLLAVGLLLAAALLLQYCRRRCGSTSKQPSSELPLSRPSSSPPTKQILLRMLCSGRRRARVEPASANSSPAVMEVEDVARWFGPASRALYTIDEEDEEEERPSEEPETPFYTPPASPPAA